MIAVYNPSLVTRRVVAIPVPDGLFNVKVYDRRGGSLFRDDVHPAEGAAVLCDYFDPHNSTQCTLYVNYTVHGQ